MKTLKSMVQFVLDEKENFKKEFKPLNEKPYDFLVNVIKYAELLSQQPNIGMFVPAVFEDGAWIVLEEPDSSNYTHNGNFDDDFYYLDLDKYQQAKSKVLFKGWEFFKFYDEGLFRLKNKDYTLFFDIEFDECHIDNPEIYEQIHTLEDLVKFNLEMR
jgi:hypothetical protein